MMTPAKQAGPVAVYFMEVIMFCQAHGERADLVVAVGKDQRHEIFVPDVHEIKDRHGDDAGEAIGIMTFHMAFISEQPSIMAASASAVGTVEKNAVRKYTVYGRFSVVYRITSVDRCPTRFALTNQQ